MKRLLLLMLPVLLFAAAASSNPGTNPLSDAPTVYHDGALLALTTSKAVVTTTDAEPVNVNVVAHGYSTGDKVFLQSTGIGALDDKYWTVTVGTGGPGANNFTLDGSTAPGSAASTGNTKKVIATGRECGPRPGRRCFFVFGDSDASNYLDNSAPFSVAHDADICFNSDNAATTDSGATITIYRVISSDDANGSMIPTASGTSTLTHSSGDCFRAVTGRYWIETTTDPTDTTKAAVVTVTGRNR